MAKESRKRHRGSAVDDDPTPPRLNTRSKKLSSNQHGGPECQVSPQTFPTSSKVSDLPVRRKNGLVTDIGCSPSSQPPHSLPSLPPREMHHGGGGSLLKRPTSNVSTGESTGYRPLSPSAPSGSLRPVEDIVERRGLFRRVKAIICDKSISFPRKVPLLIDGFRQVVAEAEIEFAKLKDQYQSVCEELRASSQKDNEDVQDKLAARLAEDENRASKHALFDLNLDPITDGNSDVLERGVSNHLEQMLHSKICAKMLPMILELQKRCPEHESCGKLKPGESNGREQEISLEQEGAVQLEAREANGHEISPELCVKSEMQESKGHVQLNPMCGSYTDRSATPNLLDNAFSNAKAAVTRFQKEFFEGRKSEGWDSQKLDIFFARPKHVSFHAKSIVNKVLFKGFENESFNTCSGISKFPDTNLRQAKFYEYYQRHRDEDDIEDPQFEEFCKMKASRLWKMLRRFCGKNMEELGGPNLDLKFRAVARSVWLLHKLAFSFEPPASIFRVEQGVEVDPNYMDKMVELEDDERFVAKVGFMMTPGLRLRESVMPCEVYLSAASISPRPSTD